ncbi:MULTISPECIES: bifunctional RNase H/acid phosphatase [Streptomyces]|uniref:bifunctional RNase H/acid phosphatase n=1 Tax=Streptomyces TaxID=1883 RepID=UPI00167638A3|nr:MULTISPECIES: bifunctional RNase H/acid phosphatase [Streptomyces]MBK3522899.1 bifunctional RNase H/acid phosphatase [Streptomyces sp. MBT70]GGS11884.1 bifunctional RNase H/acid phosphatase [Streptomyces eurythermus]
MREFIVEADGGSRGNPGPAGYGAVVRDAVTGETLAEAAEYLGTATNNVAEYRGLLAGLRAAHALDPGARVRVRMDSKLVVEQMSGRWKIKHPDMKPLAMEARSVFPPDQVTYEWIPRERNKQADRLANEAMDAGARGEQWSPSLSRADLATKAGATPEPARAGADRTTGAAPADEPPSSAPTAGRPLETASAAAEGSDTAADSHAAETAPGSAVPAGGRTAGAAPESAVAAGRRAGGAEAVPAAAPGGQRPVTGGQAHPSTPGWSAAPDLGAPATLVLLRHGETPLTPQKRFSGSGGTDPALSAAGREQAHRVADALARRGTIQAIVASPLARTRETAGIVAARLDLDVTIEDGLRETDFGAWEGLTFGEVRERHPDDLNAWLADPEAHPTGGGESFAETAVRLAATRDKLVTAYQGRTVLLVTHVTPIKTLVRLALGAPPESLFRMELSAASLSAVAYYADGNASVRLFNDTSHLRP